MASLPCPNCGGQLGHNPVERRTCELLRWDAPGGVMTVNEAIAKLQAFVAADPTLGECRLCVESEKEYEFAGVLFEEFFTQHHDGEDREYRAVVIV